MPASVAGQEPDRQPVNLGEQDLVGGLPPRARDFLPACVGEARQIVEPAAADDAEDGLRHVSGDGSREVVVSAGETTRIGGAWPLVGGLGALAARRKPPLEGDGLGHNRP